MYRVLFALVAVLACAAAQWPCVPSPATEKLLDALPAADDIRFTKDQRLDQRWRLAAAYPNDLFLQLEYQNAIRRRPQLGDEWDRALGFYRGNLTPLNRFLEARLTMMTAAQRSRQTLLALAADDPEFAWAHLALVEWHAIPGRADAAASAKHIAAFLDHCPGALEAYQHFGNISDQPLVRRAAAKLRSLIAGRTDAAAVRAYRALWDLETRVAAPDAKAAVLARIKADALRLQTSGPPPDAGTYWTFRHAATLTNDPSLQRWVEDKFLKEAPESGWAFTIVSERARKDDPPPARDAKPEAWQEYQRKTAQMASDLLAKAPNAPAAIQQAWRYRSNDRSVPDEEWLALADRYEAVRRASPDLMFSVPPDPVILAEKYLERGVRLERIPRLIEEGLRLAEAAYKYPIDTTGLPLPPATDASFTHRRAELILAGYHIRRKEIGEARAVLARTEAELAKDNTQMHGYSRQLLQRRYAELAEAAGDQKEALERYRSMIARYAENATNPDVVAARRLYVAGGGKQEEFVPWAKAGTPTMPSAPPPLTFTKSLPAFELRDRTGRIWRNADLKGKTTLVNVWATWCGPCRYEHPEIQKLFDTMKTNKDVLVLTISIDENPTLIDPYLKEKGYSFPVLAARQFADQAFSTAMVPQSWIVDADGKRSDRMVSIEEFKRYRGINVQ